MKIKSAYQLIPLLLFTLFITPIINAQQIFQKGQLEFRDGKILDCFVLEESYQIYAQGVTYKESESGELKKAGFKELTQFNLGENQQFVAFEIEESPNIRAERTKLKLFLKQLEKGKINLFEYNNGQKIKWLYLQKGVSELKRLYVIRKDYASEESTTPITVDTLSTTQSPKEGKFRLERSFKKNLRDLTQDQTKLKIPNDLEVKFIRKFIKKYNDQQATQFATKSYFKQKTRIRFYLTGNYFAVDSDRNHTLPGIGEEIEFLFNKEKNRSSFTLGFVQGGKINKSDIDLEDAPFRPVESIKLNQVYLRFNTYLNIEKRFKPYFFGGLKIVTAKKGKRTYERLVNNNTDGRLLNALGFGIGAMYEFEKRGLIKLEIGNRLFPDIKIGVGYRLQ